MVRYGGPRFEYFFTHQFLNKEQDIRKEDAYRLRSILHRQERQRLAEVERVAKQQREEEERQREAERADKAKHAAIDANLAKESRLALRRERLNELAKPIVYRETAHGYTTTNGSSLRSASRGLLMPQGRAGAPYMPWVDRHRIVPPPPRPDAHRPWIGSGTEWMKAEAAAREEQKYLFAKSKRDASSVQSREEYINGIERHHASCTRKDETDDDVDEKKKRHAAVKVRSPPALGDSISDRERPPSVFSHASSNEPIKDLGTQNMDTHSTKEEVQRHLARCATDKALSEPRRPVTPFGEMTLPEVTVRLVRMQRRLQR